MDVERAVARFLMGSTGIRAFLEMPTEGEDPGDLMTVEQTGGGGTFLEPVQLDIDCWSTKSGGGRRRAREIARAVEAAVPDLDEIPDVFGPKVENTYRMADPDTRRPRYVVQASLWLCE